VYISTPYKEAAIDSFVLVANSEASFSFTILAIFKDLLAGIPSKRIQ
jgi:hypothetical protein